MVLRVPARRPLRREIVGCSCGRRRDARLVKAAFSNVAFPLDDIEVFHSDRGSEFCNGEVDALLGAFGIERSVSRPGNPYDNAVVESTNRVLKRELVRGRAFASEERLRLELFDWVNWYNNCRLHSTLGYMTPVLVQQLQAALDARLHDAGRVQGGGPDPLVVLSKKVLPDQPDHSSILHRPRYASMTSPSAMPCSEVTMQ